MQGGHRASVPLAPGPCLESVAGERPTEVPDRARHTLAVARHVGEGLNDPVAVRVVNDQRRQQLHNVGAVPRDLAEDPVPLISEIVII